MAQLASPVADLLFDGLNEPSAQLVFGCEFNELTNRGYCLGQGNHPGGLGQVARALQRVSFLMLHFCENFQDAGMVWTVREQCLAKMPGIAHSALVQAAADVTPLAVMPRPTARGPATTVATQFGFHRLDHMIDQLEALGGVRFQTSLEYQPDTFERRLTMRVAGPSSRESGKARYLTQHDTEAEDVSPRVHGAGARPDCFRASIGGRSQAAGGFLRYRLPKALAGEFLERPSVIEIREFPDAADAEEILRFEIQVNDARTVQRGQASGGIENMREPDRERCGRVASGPIEILPEVTAIRVFHGQHDQIHAAQPNPVGVEQSQDVGVGAEAMASFDFPLHAKGNGGGSIGAQVSHLERDFMTALSVVREIHVSSAATAEMTNELEPFQSRSGVEQGAR